MNIAYLAALLLLSAIQLAIVAFCAVLCIIVLFELFKGIRKLLMEEKFLPILKKVGIVGSILSVAFLPPLILTLATPSPLIIGTVGGLIGIISAVPLITISMIVVLFAKLTDKTSKEPPELQFFTSTSTLFFTGNIIAGAWIAISDYSPISKLAPSPSFLMAFEASAEVALCTVALTIVLAIAIVSAVAIFKSAKEHILQKESSEKGGQTQQKESAKPSSSQQEVDIAGLDKSENPAPSNFVG